jgi:hypothetical protein
LLLGPICPLKTFTTGLSVVQCWLVRIRSMDEALNGSSAAKERAMEAGRKLRLEEDREKVVKALDAVPEGETQAVICKLTGLQARVVGPVLAGLLAEKKVVRIRLAVRLRLDVEITQSTAEALIEFHQATAKQLDLLRRLGYEIDRPIAKRQASAMIERHLKEREGRRTT